MRLATELPYGLDQERNRLIDEIRTAFLGVSRDGGISWSEADVIDDFGSDQERQQARERDLDRRWEELVDDPRWHELECAGNWCFLDAIGFRYYLPAGMIRCIRQGEHCVLPFLLTNRRGDLESYTLGQWSGLDARQRKVIRWFLQYMVGVCRIRDPYTRHEWRRALRSHWTMV